MYSQAYLPAASATMVAPRVADAEAVPGAAADEDRAARRAVADVVAGDALNLAAVVARRVVERDHHRAAGDALRHAVLGEAAQFQVEAVDAPRAEALPRLAVEADLDLAVGSASPRGRTASAISPPTVAPTERSLFLMRNTRSAFWPVSIASQRRLEDAVVQRRLARPASRRRRAVPVICGKFFVQPRQRHVRAG